MKPTYGLARAFVSPLFVSGGFDALRNPAARVPAAQTVVDRLSKMGLPSDPTTLVRMNGGLQLGAGLLIFSGRVPRLASAALAASLVPTTLAGHRFWNETDPKLRSAQKIQFMKNLAILGGLVLVATDTKGAPSWGWRARKATTKASESISALSASFTPNSSSLLSSTGDHFNELGQRFSATATPILEHVIDQAKTAIPSIKRAHRTASDRGNTFANVTRKLAKSLTRRITDR
jgi:uncharacterized membrane protein YphA (DoxX/SURF4 family)